MDTDRWRRVEALFHRAVALGFQERADLLARECGADFELRGEVEELLRADGAGDDAFTRVEARAPSSPVKNRR